jgi:hypothetical protein
LFKDKEGEDLSFFLCRIPFFVDQQERPNVRFWHLADMQLAPMHVCFRA